MSGTFSKTFAEAGALLMLWALGLPGMALGQSSLSVDTQNRSDVVRFYNQVYQASQGVAPGWAGDVANCVAGDTSQAYKDATILRVNYYRAMAGLPGDVTLDTNLNYECQQAALMMSAQNAVSHFPTTDWSCYSAAGADAAAHSNLALGSAGPDAIDAYIDDAGDGNYYVGHRRWILYPPQQQMGTGSIPDSTAPGGSILYSAANALWVVSTPTTFPAYPEFVAWPPPGYVPYQILPQKSGLWSLGMPGANFSRVQVSMQCCGTNLALALEPLHSGDGDNTVVWRPTLPGGGQVGLTYTVAITNILVAGQVRTVNYALAIIDAEQTEVTATRLSSASLLLTWPATAHSYVLEETTALPAATNWGQAAAPAQLTNGIWSAVVPFRDPEHYYRLRQK